MRSSLPSCWIAGLSLDMGLCPVLWAGIEWLYLNYSLSDGVFYWRKESSSEIHQLKCKMNFIPADLRICNMLTQKKQTPCSMRMRFFNSSLFPQWTLKSGMKSCANSYQPSPTWNYKNLAGITLLNIQLLFLPHSIFMGTEQTCAVSKKLIAWTLVKLCQKSLLHFIRVRVID